MRLVSSCFVSCLSFVDPLGGGVVLLFSLSSLLSCLVARGLCLVAFGGLWLVSCVLWLLWLVSCGLCLVACVTSPHPAGSGVRLRLCHGRKCDARAVRRRKLQESAASVSVAHTFTLIAGYKKTDGDRSEVFGGLVRSSRLCSMAARGIWPGSVYATTKQSKPLLSRTLLAK